MRVSALIVETFSGEYECLSVGIGTEQQKSMFKNLIISGGENGKYKTGWVLDRYCKRVHFKAPKNETVKQEAVEPKPEPKPKPLKRGRPKRENKG